MPLKSLVILCRLEGDAVERVEPVYEYCEEVRVCGLCWTCIERLLWPLNGLMRVSSNILMRRCVGHSLTMLLRIRVLPVFLIHVLAGEKLLVRYRKGCR